MLASLRRIWTVALAESARTGGSFNKKTLLTLVVLGVATGLVMPMATEDGLAFDRGLYRAAVASDAALLPAMQGSHLFSFVAADDPVAAVNSGHADIAVTARHVYSLDTSKGQAAMAALKQAAKDYTFANLLIEPDQAAAFPVRVELFYETQQARTPGAAIPAGGNALPESPRPSGAGQSEEVSGGGKPNAGGGGPVTQGSSAGGFSFIPPERSVNTPETLSPPFPFRSLLLAYVFLIPMNFVVQVYAGSAIGERLGRAGEPLLASPARPWEAITGKALPYFALMMLIAAGIVLWIGASWLSLVAVAPLALVFLALEFVSAMFARSFRELTFLTVFTSVLITIYAFLPAVFTSVHPIALVSPIALVVFDLRHEAVSLGQILYATLPLTLVSLMLFVLGGALYREEDLFHQKPVLQKAIDAVARRVRGLRSGFTLSFLLIPLVFIAELLLITFLFAWPVSVGVVGVLLAVALVEELFKGAPSYAALQRGRIPVKRALVFGALVGLGFFVAEKAFLLVSLVGLLDVPAASAVFGGAGAAATASMPPLVVAGLLAGPLVLHVVTATITAYGAKHGKRTFAAAFALAVAIHTAYNLAVVTLKGGIG